MRVGPAVGYSKEMKWSFVVLALWTLILLGVLLAPIRETPTLTCGGFRHWDKVAHFGLFAITGFVGVFGARVISQFNSRMLFGILFGLFLAIGTEFAQSFISVRDMSPYDLLADVIGLGGGLLLYALLYSQQGLRTHLKL